MSYILDALRKADAEREQGAVPGLHTHPLVPSESPRAEHLNKKLVWAVIALSSVLVLLGLWLFSRHDAPPPPPDTASPLPLPVPNGPHAMRDRAGSPLPMPTPTPVTAAPTPPPSVVAPAATIYPPVEAPARSPVTDAAPVPPTPATAKQASTTKEDDSHRIYKLQDLPDSVRKDLPTISIGGAMYSDTPSQRILIINGQVLHEGDQAAPGLLLEQIKLKSAVFQFRNYRYLVNY
ncbi:MAG TPA: general secretion pathway protein GspB [Aquabacterium sp.]|nr:general secretion pathway protein GspB [Aquabacterium sp.]